MITIYKTLFQTATPFYKDILFVLDRIKTGTSKDIVLAIRKEKDKEKRNELKKQLPAICFSGVFSNRSVAGLKEHSGYICLDFDGYNSVAEMLIFRKSIEADEFTFSVFTSPSGDGLKVLVKIPANPSKHRDYFLSLEKKYDSENFDVSCKDVSRVCYESFDKDIYINTNSKVWDKDLNDSGFKYIERVPTVILDDESEIISRLIKWFDKSHSMDSNRNNNLFILASAFNEYGVTESSAKNYCSRYEQKDFTDSEISRTIRSAYSKVANKGTKYFEDHTRINQIKTDLKSGKSIEDIKSENKDISPDSINEISESNPTDVFWFLTRRGIAIDNYKYKIWLQENGFFKFYPEGSESFVFVRVENNLIDNTTEVKIKDFVLGYLLEQKQLQVYQYMTNFPKFFKEDNLNTLEATNVQFKNDTKLISYLYFNNCAVEVSENNVRLIDYIDLDGFVWKKHIIPFDYKISDVECDFKKFIFNISGKDTGKELSIRTTIGYMLSSFKNASNNVAVILNDEMISENPNGGTGKGIMISAISKLKRCSIIDGKNFNFQKSFPYQTVSADTQIIVFDDVVKNFPFENLFSVVTEGITLEKKNKDAITIPVSKSPKVLITTNYAIAGDGNSFDRRKWEIEFSQYYKKTYTPQDEFGRLLFDDWDGPQWNNFYSYMIKSLQLFISKGLVKSEFNNLHIRQFIASTNFDFWDFIKEDRVAKNERINKQDKYHEFIEQYPDFKAKLKQRTFTSWIYKYANFIGAEISEGHSLNTRWLILKTQEAEKLNDEQLIYT